MDVFVPILVLAVIALIYLVIALFRRMHEEADQERWHKESLSEPRARGKDWATRGHWLEDIMQDANLGHGEELSSEITFDDKQTQDRDSRVIGYKIGKPHSNLINCSECNFEQSDVYSECQKCGAKFSDD